MQALIAARERESLPGNNREATFAAKSQGNLPPSPVSNPPPPSLATAYLHETLEEVDVRVATNQDDGLLEHTASALLRRISARSTQATVAGKGNGGALTPKNTTLMLTRHVLERGKTREPDAIAKHDVHS